MSARTDWFLIATIFVTGLFAAAQFAKVSLLLPALQAQFDRSLFDVSLLVTSVAIVGLTLGVLAGQVVAGLGARRVAMAAAVGAAALSMLQAMLPSYPVFFLLRVLEGACHLALVVAGPVLMSAAASDRDRPIAMSIWAMFFGVAFSISASLFPFMINKVGLGGLYFAHGTGLILCAAVLWWRAPVDAAAPKWARVSPIALHRRIYASGRQSLPGLSFFPYAFTFIALLAFLPSQLPQARLGEILPILSLAGTFGAGWAARRISPETLGQWGYVLTGAGAIAVGLGASWAVYPMFLAIGIMPGASFASIPHFNADADDRARAAGAVAQMGNLGTSSGTPIFGVVVLSLGLPGLMAFTAVVCAVGFALIHITRQRIVSSV